MMEVPRPAISTERLQGTCPGSKLAERTVEPVFLCLALALVTLAIYWPAIGFHFISYDDPGYFAKNPHVQAGLTWNGILWAFGSGETGNWHPLTWLSFMCDVSFFGPGDPAGPHFTNIFLHALNGVFLFLLLRSLTGANGRSFFVAGLFALHPLNVESVAWISERKNVLSTFFWFLTMWFYARYARWSLATAPEENAGKPIRFARHRFLNPDYALTVLFFASGLMSKSMLVTLPFVLLLLDYWPLGRWQADSSQAWRIQLPHLLWGKAPIFLLSALACIVTLLAQSHDNSIKTLNQFPISGRIENAFVSYIRYLGKTFWPDNLALFYSHPVHWSPSVVVPAVMFVFAVCLVALWLRRQYPFFVVGWFWFLGTLVPVIGLVQIGLQAMADRYAYVPLVGLFIITAWGAAEATAHWNFPKTLTVIGAVLVLTACALRTRDQLGYWRNDLAVFGHTVAVDSNDMRMHLNFAIALENAGRPDEAVKEYREAIRIDPDSPEAHYNLGCALADLGQRAEAIAQFKQALEQRPDFPLAERALRALETAPPPPP